MNVLVTGGAGYIGSHASLRLLEDGHAVTVVDDLSRGHRRVAEILGPLGDLKFVQADLGDQPHVAQIMRERSIDLVMHFGAKAYVGESVRMPLQYYRANTAASLGLLGAMDDAGVGRLVFSSTCASYGEPAAEHIPIAETCPQQPVNPYGRSKLYVEHMIRDHARAKRAAGQSLAWAALRYFNVAGCDPDGRLGEDHDPETHLVPICIDAALGRREGLTVFGCDYPTPDGTCIRDYVHVTDLINAHMQVIGQLDNEASQPEDDIIYNVGLGRGYSVREVIDAVRAVMRVDFHAGFGERRAGDPPVLYCQPAKINTQLGWSATYTLHDMIEHAWHWRRDHPQGYR